MVFGAKATSKTRAARLHSPCYCIPFLCNACVSRYKEPRVFVVHIHISLVFIGDRYILETVVLLFLKNDLVVFHNSYPFLICLFYMEALYFYIVSPHTYNIAFKLKIVNSFGANSYL